jgi:hypothetical protein
MESRTLVASRSALPSKATNAKPADFLPCDGDPRARSGDPSPCVLSGSHSASNVEAGQDHSRAGQGTSGNFRSALAEPRRVADSQRRICLRNRGGCRVEPGPNIYDGRRFAKAPNTPSPSRRATRRRRTTFRAGWNPPGIATSAARSQRSVASTGIGGPPSRG